MEKKEEKIKEIISERLGVPLQEISPKAYLTEDLGASPVEIADLFAALEERFETSFEDEDKEKTKTIEQLITLVASQSSEFEDEEA